MPLHLAVNDVDALRERCETAEVRTIRDRPEYERGAVIPSGLWQPLTEPVGRTLTAPSWTPPSTLVEIVRPPEPGEDDQEHLADEMCDPDVQYLGQARAKANMTTTTENYAAGLLLGLHLDNWDKLIHGAKARGRRRLALNLGPGTRYIILGGLDAQAVCRAVHPDDYALRHPHTNDYREHVAAGNPIRVVRVRISPGEGYIAPTEYLLHDGSTERPGRAVRHGLLARPLVPRSPALPHMRRPAGGGCSYAGSPPKHRWASADSPIPILTPARRHPQVNG
ncbi:hypothetical protein AB0I68_03275 [Streptomyces sp. NPDC050448]|uniref:hypothetical protein n=1 Tax=Streptomyces sp. NPDC050448 TaxID=3155404 RepID=UPI003412FB9E